MTANRCMPITFAFTLLVGAGCGAEQVPSAPLADHAVTAAAGGYQDRVRRKLEDAAEGLLYTSESDYPFDYYFRTAAIDGPIDASTFRRLAHVPPDSLVEERTLDAFFARHIELVDPFDPVGVALIPEYAKLKRTIEQELANPRVFRVGTIAIRCYVIGTDRDGNVVGLTTTAIET